MAGESHRAIWTRIIIIMGATLRRKWQMVGDGMVKFFRRSFELRPLCYLQFLYNRGKKECKKKKMKSIIVRSDPAWFSVSIARDRQR